MLPATARAAMRAVSSSLACTVVCGGVETADDSVVPSVVEFSTTGGAVLATAGENVPTQLAVYGANTTMSLIAAAPSKFVFVVKSIVVLHENDPD